MPGLYIHVPFCVRKCGYCDFYSRPTGSFRGDAVPGQRAFLDALDTELKNLPPGFAPETIFIGGGTPTELANADFRDLFDGVHQYVDLSQVKEWTCESNPGTLTEAKVDLMRRSGVNRVSLGVQSFTPELLTFLGRIHSADEAIASYTMLRRMGVRNINLDLMYGIPGQTLAQVTADLEQAIALGPEHLACYGLIFEEGTPLTRQRDRGLVKEVGDEEELEQYERVRTTLTGAGYDHYEISNYARPGRECQHNLLYWGNGEYIGCGPSAHSHQNGHRYANIRNLDAYLLRMKRDGQARDFDEALEPSARAREALVMFLRRIKGVGREEFRKATGFDYHALRGAEIDWLEESGMLDATGERLRLTPRGVMVSDAVFAELV